MNEKNNFDLGKDERYFYVYLTEKLNEGTASKHTPQHITLVPPFVADEQLVVGVAEQVASRFHPFKIKLDGKAMIGPKEDISVIAVKPCKYLQAIHVSLFDELEKQKINTGYTRYIRDEFTPHVTIKKYLPDIDETKSMIFDHIAVMHKHKDIKTVLAIYNLGK